MSSTGQERRVLLRARAAGDRFEHHQYYGMPAFWTPWYVCPGLPPAGTRRT